MPCLSQVRSPSSQEWLAQSIRQGGMELGVLLQLHAVLVFLLESVVPELGLILVRHLPAAHSTGARLEAWTHGLLLVVAWIAVARDLTFAIDAISRNSGEARYTQLRAWSA